VAYKLILFVWLYFLQIGAHFYFYFPIVPIAFAQYLVWHVFLFFFFLLLLYLEQRNKELSYTLRLCHLHPTNGDGTQAATFGFELSEEPDYEYPLILRVEPHSSAEGAGLQSRDILLKINDRKTKGLGYDKVKKEIEKAKRDGRLEMLVVDQETYDYCKRAKKPLKEPEMKVKHVFPKSRSSASFHKLPIIAASSLASRDSVEQLGHSITKYDDNNPSHHRTSVGYHLSTSRETDSENEEDKEQSLSEQKTSSITPSQAKTAHHSQPVVNFDLAPPATAQAKASDHPQESPLKFLDRSQTASQQVDTSSTRKSSTPSKAQSTTSLSQTSTKESKGSRAKSIPNAINNLIHRIGHSKSSKRS
jgi:thioredoxin-related protein